MPFHFVQPAVIGADLVLVIALSVVTGVGYHWIFLNRLPDIWPYVAIGALANAAVIDAAPARIRKARFSHQLARIPISSRCSVNS